MWYLNQPILTFVLKNNIWKRNKLSMFFFCWGYCENKRKLRPPLTPWKVLAKTCLSSPETYSTSCLWLDWGWKHLKFNNSKQLQMKRLYFFDSKSNNQFWAHSWKKTSILCICINPSVKYSVKADGSIQILHSKLCIVPTVLVGEFIYWDALVTWQCNFVYWWHK